MICSAWFDNALYYKIARNPWSTCSGESCMYFNSALNMYFFVTIIIIQVLMSWSKYTLKMHHKDGPCLDTYMKTEGLIPERNW